MDFNIWTCISTSLILGLSGLLTYSYISNKNLQQENSKLIYNNEILNFDNEKIRSLNYNLMSVNESISNAVNEEESLFKEKNIEVLLDINPIKWFLLYNFDLFCAYNNIEAYTPFLLENKIYYQESINSLNYKCDFLKESIKTLTNDIFKSLNKNKSYYTYSLREAQIINYEINSFIDKIKFFTKDYAINELIEKNAFNQNIILRQNFELQSRLSVVTNYNKFSLPYSFDKNYQVIPENIKNSFNKDIYINSFRSFSEN